MLFLSIRHVVPLQRKQLRNIIYVIITCVCGLVHHVRIVFAFTLVVRDDIYCCTIVYKMYSVDLKNEDKIEKTGEKLECL